jgi:HPt (histidine-containing phosphotransfer) domain-containing protein
LSRGNEDFVEKMIAIFVEQTYQVLMDLDIALQENNFIQIGRLIHKIKPSIESLGISSISTEIAMLEKKAKKTANREEIVALLHSIKPILKLAITQLQKNELKE